MLLKIIMSVFGFHAIDGFFQGIAKGDRGVAARDAYLWLQGKKTWLGMTLAMVAVALFSLGDVRASASILFVAYVTTRIGVVDAAWRSVPPAVSSAGFFVFLRDHWGYVAGVLGGWLTYAMTCSPETAATLAQVHVGSYHLTCKILTGVLTVLIAEFGWAVGTARLADAPRGGGLVLQVLQPASVSSSSTKGFSS